MIVVMHEKNPCIIFCSAKRWTGILIFDVIAIDCKSVEIPPKLITKDVAKMAKYLFDKSESDRDPFVISITPCKMAEMPSGKRQNSGIKVSIMIKKMTIIHPTESIESVELSTISLISK